MVAHFNDDPCLRRGQRQRQGRARIANRVGHQFADHQFGRIDDLGPLAPFSEVGDDELSARADLVAVGDHGPGGYPGTDGVFGTQQQQGSVVGAGRADPGQDGLTDGFPDHPGVPQFLRQKADAVLDI